MRVLLAIAGVVFILLMGFIGLFAGEVKRVQDDPEVKAEIERRKKELERQKAWKDNFK